MGKGIFRTLVLLATSLVLSHCSSKKESAPPAELNAALVKAGNPNFNVLTKMLIHKHQVAFNSSGLAQDQAKWTDAEFTNAIVELTPSNVASMDGFTVKLAIDEKLVKRNGGKPLLYNRDHTTIASPMRLGRMQCYSGSILQLLVTRQMTAAQFQKLKMVMILTPGHIMPGFMVSEGGSYRLLGIETTVVGRGRTDFGLSRNLNIAIRVIDADVFTQMEVLGNAIENSQEVMQWALQETAKLYDIPLQKTEALVAAANGGEMVAADKNSSVNSSIFGFGTANDVPPAGDIERAVRNDIPTNKGPVTDRFIQSEESAPPVAAPVVVGVPAERLARYETRPMNYAFGNNRFASGFQPISDLLVGSFNDSRCAADIQASATAETFLSKVRAVLDVLGALTEEKLSDPNAIMAAMEPLVKGLPIRETQSMGGNGQNCQRGDNATVQCDFGSPGLLGEGFGVYFIVKGQKLVLLSAGNQRLVRGKVESDAELNFCGNIYYNRICLFGQISGLYITSFGETEFDDLTANFRMDEALGLGFRKSSEMLVSKEFKDRGRIRQRCAGASLCSPVIPGTDEDRNPKSKNGI